LQLHHLRRQCNRSYVREGFSFLYLYEALLKKAEDKDLRNGPISLCKANRKLLRVMMTFVLKRSVAPKENL